LLLLFLETAAPAADVEDMAAADELVEDGCNDDNDDCEDLAPERTKRARLLAGVDLDSRATGLSKTLHKYGISGHVCTSRAFQDCATQHGIRWLESCTMVPDVRFER
jgi:hypothetical protein